MQVLVTSFGELEENAYLDPRTTQVAIVDHVKQVSLAPSQQNKKKGKVRGIEFVNIEFSKHIIVR